MIDGLDINTLKLTDLRSRLTIIPQECSLFAGTIRFNLDPFDRFEDVSIWDALRRVEMASPLNSGAHTPSLGATLEENSDKYAIKTLEMEVLDGGKNFSAG